MSVERGTCTGEVVATKADTTTSHSTEDGKHRTARLAGLSISPSLPSL